MGRIREGAVAHAARRAWVRAGIGGGALAALLGCGGAMPPIRSSLLPPVVAWSGDSVTLGDRRFHR
ncbi:MAG: hypothetical protein ACXW61_03100, partial [Gemmatirosa sp.]